jgi:hypothetical protein
MDDKERHSAFLSALTTEHFVLQTAASSTISEAAARGSLYLFSLSSALVAMGFTSQSREVFMPFVATVVPAVFLLGLFTIKRLVDTTLENLQYLAGIARIRSYYRTLTPDAARYFAAETGRWPEVKTTPSLRFGPLVPFFSTTASMIACVNNIVAGAGVTLLANALLGGHPIGLAVVFGIGAAIAFTLVFLAYQHSRFKTLDLAMLGPSPVPPASASAPADNNLNSHGHAERRSKSTEE